MRPTEVVTTLYAIELFDGTYLNEIVLTAETGAVWRYDELPLSTELNSVRLFYYADGARLWWTSHVSDSQEHTPKLVAIKRTMQRIGNAEELMLPATQPATPERLEMPTFPSEFYNHCPKATNAADLLRSVANAEEGVALSLEDLSVFAQCAFVKRGFGMLCESCGLFLTRPFTNHKVDEKFLPLIEKYYSDLAAWGTKVEANGSAGR